MKRILIGLILGLAATAYAATNVTLSLSDDFNILVKYGCGQAKGSACSVPAAKAWAEDQIESLLVSSLRNLRRSEASSRLSAFCALFNASSTASKDVYCTAIGESVSCTPPQCQ